MDAWDTLYFLIVLITDESKHFLLSSAMGSLAWLLTWTISSAFYLGLARLTRRRTRSDVGYGILIYCLPVGLAFALASHWLLDYGSILLTMPLGPPLDIH